MPLKISIIICTRNRALSLQSTLSAILHQARQKNTKKNIEVIIVDNNSSDKTKHVVKTAVRQYPQIRISYILEKNIGISFARNSGLAKSRAPAVSFIDDDTHISRSWLSRALKYLSIHTNGVIVGKLTIQSSVRNHPIIRVISKYDILWSIGISDLGEKPRKITEHSFVLINNAIIYKSVFSQVGQFDDAFGNLHKRFKVFGGEDVDLMERIFRAHIPIFYEPSLMALHKILAHKLTWEYMKWRYYENGRERAVYQHKYNTYPRSNISLFLARWYTTYIPKILLFLRLQKPISPYILWCKLKKAFLQGYILAVK